MKVHAIRVAQFGRFKEPVALEGLSGGLNLFIGPNEAGKSTLFRALQLALFMNHRTTRAELAEVRPYGGGAPLVEAEIEIAGERWRIRKRFLSDRSAELASVGRGVSMRGADAEETLQKLLADAGVAGGRALLWPRQGELLAPVALPNAGKDVLQAAIDQEVTMAAGGDAIRRVRRRVRDALATLVTTQQQRPRGAYLEAINGAERAANALARARVEAREVEHRLERLAELDDRLHQEVHPGRRAALRCRLEEADQALREARQRISERETARTELIKARAAHDTAAASVKVLDEGLAELEELERIARESAGQLGALSQQLAVADAELAAAEAVRADAARDCHEAEARFKRADGLVRWRALASRAARARAAADRVRELQRQMCGLPLDETPIREARKLEAQIASGAVRLATASAAVMIRYEPGADQSVVVAGRPVADGERLQASTLLVLTIPGLGRIEIEPGASQDRAQIGTALSADRCALRALLAAAGVADVSELEARHDLARRLAMELGAAGAEEKAIAPEGLAQLEVAEQAASIEVGAPEGDDVAEPDMVALAGELDASRARLQGLNEACRRQVEARDQIRQRLTVLQVRAEERQVRLSVLAASLPPHEARAREREAAVSSVRGASEALDAALRLERLAGAAAPDAETLQRLDVEVVAARAAIEAGDRARSALEKDKARIEGELDAARREDVGARLVELEAEAERSQAARDKLAEEVQALQLLDVELGAEEQRLRDGYLAPVLARLGPYIEAVFPGAAVSLGDGYTVEALRRGGLAEGLESLSDGTREQIAVLVRLAFARLLADRGLEVPLVLDDALVYADDRRIAAMHRALEAAARSHQVIVLSCREQAFGGLSGTRVAITPWQPERHWQ
jgi:energy-coupling factor transporter ATP-binding protein EcfA2